MREKKSHFYSWFMLRSGWRQQSASCDTHGVASCSSLTCRSWAFLRKTVKVKVHASFIPSRKETQMGSQTTKRKFSHSCFLLAMFTDMANNIQVNTAGNRTTVSAVVCKCFAPAPSIIAKTKAYYYNYNAAAGHNGIGSMTTSTQACEALSQTHWADIC